MKSLGNAVTLGIETCYIINDIMVWKPIMYIFSFNIHCTWHVHWLSYTNLEKHSEWVYPIWDLSDHVPCQMVFVSGFGWLISVDNLYHLNVYYDKKRKQKKKNSLKAVYCLISYLMFWKSSAWYLDFKSFWGSLIKLHFL